MGLVTFWIDGRQVRAKSGLTVMEAADELGVVIPRLCFHPALRPNGSCRLCAVEIDDFRGLPAACSTPVEPGMRVRTATARVLDFRREMLRVILQDHPRECLGCPRNGTCELQRLVETVGIDFPYSPQEFGRHRAEEAGRYFERDYDLCVHCGRCVRVCHEVRGAKAIVFREKHGRQEVGTPFDRPLEETGCQFCGACVDVCPVGALREKLPPDGSGGLQEMLQGCGELSSIVMALYRKELPRSVKTSVCTVCSAGCSMEFEMAGGGGIIRVRPSVGETSNRGQACVQGRFLLKEYLGRSDRLLMPMIRENGSLRETGWDAVLDFIADRFLSYRPEETAVLTDGRCTNEELRSLQEFSRTVLRTDAFGCVCPPGHAAASEILRETTGTPGGMGCLQELERADCILLLGLNPPASWPIAGTRLREAALGGTKLVAANPCKVGAARFADVHLQHYPGTETILVAGLIRLLLDRNQVHPDIAGRWETELKALGEHLSSFHPGEVSRITGVSPEDLVEAACLIGRSETLSVLYGLGVVASPRVAETVRAMLALLQIKGNLGKPGCVVAPLYGNGNLLGAWEAGMASGHLSGLPAQGGASPYAPFDVLAAIDSGKIRALYLACESLEGDALDSIGPLLDKPEFVVVHDVAIPRAKSRAPGGVGDVNLPMAAALEKGGSYLAGGRKVRRIEPVVAPPGEARSVVWVVTELARRMHARGFVSMDSPVSADESKSCVPACTAESRGCDRGGPRSTDLCPAEPKGEPAQRWIGWKPDDPGTPEDPRDAEYPVAVIVREALRPYCLGPLLARESAAFFGSDEELEMNPADVFGMGMSAGDAARVVTRHGEWEGRIRINDLIPVKTLAVSGSIVRLHVDLRDIAGGAFAARVVKR